MNDEDLKEYQIQQDMLEGQKGSICHYDDQHPIPDRVLDNGMAQELRVASQQNADQDESEQKMNKKKQISTQPLSSKFLAACRQELHDQD